MFVKKVRTYKQRYFLQIAESYRGEDGKSHHRTVEKLGYLDELDGEHGDGMAWARARARELTEGERAAPGAAPSPGRLLEPGKSSLRNVGSLSLLPVYERIGIPKAMEAIQSAHPKLR